MTHTSLPSSQTTVSRGVSIRRDSTEEVEWSARTVASVLSVQLTPCPCPSSSRGRDRGWPSWRIGRQQMEEPRKPARHDRPAREGSLKDGRSWPEMPAPQERVKGRKSPTLPHARRSKGNTRRNLEPLRPQTDTSAPLEQGKRVRAPKS